MNFYALFGVVFIQMNKVIVNMGKMQPLDLVILVNIVMVIAAAATICMSSSLSFVIPADSRKLFFTRTTIGWILMTVYIFGNTLVPITV